MNIRLAQEKDLENLKNMYRKIVDNMNKNNIEIWDEIYPYEFLKDDIHNKDLYVMAEENGNIAAAFALCKSNVGERCVTWENPKAKAFYIDRLGVNVDYARRGLAMKMLEHACHLVKEKKAEYLRLFVVDINKPAIDLYKKYGFTKINDIYEEKIDDDLTLREYGFEIKVE